MCKSGFFMFQASEIKGAVLQYKGSNESQINYLNCASTNLNMGNIRTDIFFSSIWNTAAVTAVCYVPARNSNPFRKQEKKKLWKRKHCLSQDCVHFVNSWTLPGPYLEHE